MLVQVRCIWEIVMDESPLISVCNRIGDSRHPLGRSEFTKPAPFVFVGVFVCDGVARFAARLSGTQNWTLSGPIIFAICLHSTSSPRSQVSRGDLVGLFGLVR